MHGFACKFYDQPPLNFKDMNKAAKLLLKNEDFSAFSKANSQTKTNLCNIKEAEWENHEDRGQVVFYIRSNRFLRGMVRGIVGTLMRVGQGKISVDDFQEIIVSKDRQKVYFDAPPEGLYLMHVEYPFKMPKV